MIASCEWCADLSALGHNNLIWVQGAVRPSGGTSVSAPIIAAIVALLNEISLSKRNSTLGFLNPLLYKMGQEAPATFNDVTEGDNRCTLAGIFAGCKGWFATKGWDPGAVSLRCFPFGRVLRVAKYLRMLAAVIPMLVQ